MGGAGVIGGAGAETRWRFWIDRGGTFTDIVAQHGDAPPQLMKLLSESPGQYADAAVEGIRRVLGLEAGEAVPAGQIEHVRMGTTVATNALLERAGAPVALVVSDGFADLLSIGRQARPRLFDLEIRKPEPLPVATEEIAGRVGLDGDVLEPLDLAGARAALERAWAAGARSCAIALLHAWKHPEMERAVEAVARAVGFGHVSVSHRVSGVIGYYPRAATTVVDAYLSPVLGRYVEQVTAALGDVPVSFMQSNGGLVEAAGFAGKDAILSGPAGGIVGMARTAEAEGFARVVGFDMGGTSTDVSVHDGALERVFETEVAGVPLSVPMLDIHTVAAGGGSVLSVTGGRLRVGPESAGADPGPGAYRRGGPPTVTDANILLGRIQPDAFPATFGPGGDEPLDTAAVRAAFEGLAADYAAQTGQAIGPEALAEAFVGLAVSNMARAIKQVTLDRGRDLEGFALQAFGGAGGQHACAVADALGIDRVLVHPFAGVLSALGIGLADVRDVCRVAVERPLDAAAAEEVVARLDALEAEQRDALAGDGEVEVRRTVSLRYGGTDTALEVAFGAMDAMVAAFEAAHRARFGFAMEGRSLVVAAVSSEAVRAGAGLAGLAVGPGAGAGAGPGDGPGDGVVAVWSGGRRRDAPLLARDALSVGQTIDGPALVCDAGATTVIDADWRAHVAASGTLVLERAAPRARPRLSAKGPADPLQLALFNNMFMAAAERMGGVLRETATSVNIKERLDFSCAVFDASGGLIANAPHVPVHLGAMGESVRAVLASRAGKLRPGDMVALNNPYNGGTHLPDVTLIAPVFDRNGTTLRGFVANRGHHSDIGGTLPGSTPPDAVTLEEEGVVLDDLLVCRGGTFDETGFRAALADAPYPARSPETNVSDLRAQIAANRSGIAEMEAMSTRYGWDVVEAYAGHVMDHAEARVRAVIAALPDGAVRYRLDNGAEIHVAIRVDRKARRATLDFTGTSAQHRGNFNAPPAVTRAAALYVFRCLVDDDLPLNEGCMRPLALVIPEGTLLSPRPGAAVVAGNTEISQGVCNALFLATGALAAGQGTMNNLLLGNDSTQYYETICGGAGAGPGFPGADAVHTHMTNTRITDPEILEARYPMRVRRFAVRAGSAGEGAMGGGAGIIREIEALAPMTLSMVSSSRLVAPPGLCGGGPGAPGRQWIRRADGHEAALGAVARAELSIGDRIVVETPGGGGYGSP
ncbi:MAG: hydantoinase B/oxoprolinase family protein [Pseudomonadota bacterium]